MSWLAEEHVPWLRTAVAVESNVLTGRGREETV